MDEQNIQTPFLRHQLLWGLVGGTLALCACGGDYTEEKIEVEIGYRGEASRNPFLAAQRMCEQYGVSSERRSSLVDLPHYGTTLALSSDGVTSRGSAEVIRNWVNEGGTLIYFIEFASRFHNDFMAEAPGANPFHKAVKNEGDDFLLEYFKVSTSYPGGDEDHSSITFQERAYEVEFQSSLLLNFDSGSSSRDASGGPRPILEFAYGDGDVILVADAHPFRNRQIGEHEHAALFWAMIDQTGNGHLLIVDGADLSFLALLWSRGWMVIVPILLVLVIWIWKNFPRHGPLLPDETLSKRDFARHIDATGDFLWRQQAISQLLGPLRRRILHRLRSTMGWEDAARTEEHQWTALADRTGMPVQRIQDALLGDPGREPNRFVQLCRDLNTLEEQL